ncbi:MAG: hypothetical protein FJ255_01340 [Phycisphaerae bacterium]|nr:hypothetical protein [Phycisphaerae bacterium]
MKPGAAPSKGGKLTQAQKVKIAVAVVCIVVGVGLATYSLGLFGESAPPTEAPANYDPAAGAVEGASKAQEQRAAELQRMRDAAAARGQPLPEGGS